MKKIVKEFALFFLFSGIAIKVSSSDKICEAETLVLHKIVSGNRMCIKITELSGVYMSQARFTRRS